MTCREKLAMEHPDCIDRTAGGGCVNCPSAYGYLDNPKWCGYSEELCRDCWDREIPEEKEEKTANTVNNSTTIVNFPSSVDGLMNFIDKVLASKNHQIDIFWTPDGNTSVSIKPWPDPKD